MPGRRPPWPSKSEAQPAPRVRACASRKWRAAAPVPSSWSVSLHVPCWVLGLHQQAFVEPDGGAHGATLPSRTYVCQRGSRPDVSRLLAAIRRLPHRRNDDAEGVRTTPRPRRLRRSASASGRASESGRGSRCRGRKRHGATSVGLVAEHQAHGPRRAPRVEVDCVGGSSRRRPLHSRRPLVPWLDRQRACRLDPPRAPWSRPRGRSWQSRGAAARGADLGAA